MIDSKPDVKSKSKKIHFFVDDVNASLS